MMMMNENITKKQKQIDLNRISSSGPIKSNMNEGGQTCRRNRIL
jgi:hypothetical protein